MSGCSAGAVVSSIAMYSRNFCLDDRVWITRAAYPPNHRSTAGITSQFVLS